MPNLIIQIPCFNEETTIQQTLQDLPRQIDGIDKILVLIIDDGSTDRTAEISLISGADFVVQHPYNRGLAKAFMTGIQTSLALGADIIVNTDADNQYPGRYIPELIQPILAGNASLVIGDRQVHQVEHFSPIKRLLERLGSWVMRLVSQTNVNDAPSGFRAYSRYTALHLQVFNRYSYTLETLIQAGREKIPIAQIPIETNAPTRESRLHKGLLHFIWRQTGTIIRSYVLYQPLQTFILLSIPFLFSSLILIGRFIILSLMQLGGIARYIQSVSIGGTLGVVGFILMLIGLIADAVRTNRQIMEEITVNLRTTAQISAETTNFNGCKIYRSVRRSGPVKDEVK